MIRSSSHPHILWFSNGGAGELDLHVHTCYSGKTTIYPLSLFMRESYNTPEGVHRRAKARGMHLVTITEPRSDRRALTIADREDVIIGCEVTAVVPGQPGARPSGSAGDQLSSAALRGRDCSRTSGGMAEDIPAS